MGRRNSLQAPGVRPSASLYAISETVRARDVSPAMPYCRPGRCAGMQPLRAGYIYATADHCEDRQYNFASGYVISGVVRRYFCFFLHLCSHKYVITV